MTEAGPVLTVSPRVGWKHGSVGVLLPLTEARVVDVQTGEDLPAGQDGDVYVRCPQIMTGKKLWVI